GRGVRHAGVLPPVVRARRRRPGRGRLARREAAVRGRLNPRRPSGALPVRRGRTRIRRQVTGPGARRTGAGSVGSGSSPWSGPHRPAGTGSRDGAHGRTPSAIRISWSLTDPPADPVTPTPGQIGRAS